MNVFFALRRFLLIVWVLLLATATAAWADANSVSANKGMLNGFYNGGLAGGPTYQFNYSVSFKLWSLLKEPVYDVKFKWSFDDRALVPRLNFYGEDEDVPRNQRIRDLDPDVQGGFRPYDVKVRIDGHPENDRSLQVYVLWDVGVPGKSGEKSYNTPASPKDWGDVFRTSMSDNPVRADLAKDIFKAGFIATEVRIVSIKWHDEAYRRFVAKTYPRGKREALDRAARQQIKLLADVEGLNDAAVQKLTARLDAKMAEADARRRRGDPRFMQGLETLVAKLNAGIPPAMRDGNRNDVYDKERAAIQAEYNAAIKKGGRLLLNTRSDYADWAKAKRTEIAARKIPEPDPEPDPNLLLRMPPNWNFRLCVGKC